MPKPKIKEEAKKAKKSKVAYVLLFVAVLFLFVNSVFALLARKQISIILEQYGIISSELALVTYALIWLIIGTLAWTTNYKIDKTNNRNHKWMLFILSIITMIAGRIEAGIIMLIASILYLRQK